MKDIGSKIKKIRELRNFTQEYVAEKLGVNQSTYSRLEKDGSEISLSQLEQLLAILGISLENLLNFDEKNVFINFSTNIANQHPYSTIHDTSLQGEIIQLYKDKITLLEEKIKHLEQAFKK